MSVFIDLLNNQKSQKNLYNVSIDTCLKIEIKNNKIINIILASGWIHESRKNSYIKLIKDVLEKYQLKDGIISINLDDFPKKGVLNFCRDKNNSEGCFLIPFARFILDDTKLSINEDTNNFNYFQTTNYLKSLHDNYMFKDKINKFYLNGLDARGKRLNYYLYALQNRSICDGHLYGGGVHKYGYTPPHLIKLLKENNLASEQYDYFDSHFKYKYIIYYEGNTLSDRMRLLLNTNSVIIYKKSIYEEFYTYLLKDNINYIEYEHENELRNIYNKLENDDKLCLQIIDNNKKFVDEILTYDNILKYTADLLNILL